MLREEVLQTWKTCKEKIFQLKKKSIDNYPIMNKRTILGLNNSYVSSPLQLHDFTVKFGDITERKDSAIKSRNIVEIHTELLKVAILEDLQVDDTPLEEIYLRNCSNKLYY